MAQAEHSAAPVARPPWRGWPWCWAAAIVLASVAYVAGRALFDPDIEFLRPSRRGQWIVSPRPGIRFRGTPTTPDLTFTRHVPLAAVPERCEVRITAMRGFDLQVNGTSVDVAQPPSWKRAATVDLAPHFVTGTNTVAVRVHGSTGPPALLVEGPANIRTGPGWTLGARKRGIGPPAAHPFRGERFMDDNGNPLRRSDRFPLYRALLIAYLLFILYALIPRRWKPWMGPIEAAREPRKRPRIVGWLLRHGLCLVILVVAATAHFKNAHDYDHRRAPFDVGGHTEYIRHAAQHWTVPKATDGWEMFQPPLYYFVAGGILRLRGDPTGSEPAAWKAVQYFTTAAAIAGLAACWGLLCFIFPHKPAARAMGLSMAAMLPVGLYMSPMVTNEVFAGGLIAIGIVAACCLGPVSRRAPWWMIGVAALCALGLLAKFTGFFLFLALLMAAGLCVLAQPRNYRTWVSLAILLAVVGGGTGWYYARNIREYDNAFIGNWDEASGFHYEQAPGYRTTRFYTRFGQVLFGSSERSRHASFWDGQYGTTWGDSHGAMIRPNRPRPGSTVPDKPDPETLAAVVVWLALLPTAGLLAGVVCALWHVLTVNWRHPYLILLLTTLFTVTGVIFFTMETPTYTTIKAFFMLSLLPAAAVYAALGLDLMRRNLGRLHWAMVASLTLLYILILYLFRY